MTIDVTRIDTPAAYACLFGNPGGDMPPLPSSDGCADCPFAALNEDQNLRHEIMNDEAEAYYACTLIPDPNVWGEEPKCTIDHWQAQARKELGL